MESRVRIRWFVLWIGALLLASLASAQVDQSRLVGTVTDPSGARIPEATVTAIQPATGLLRKTETSSAGTYVMDDLPIGAYIVTISKAGFADVHFKDVEQSVGQTRVLNARLPVGTVAKTITVSERSARLDTASAAVGGSINLLELRELPLNGRNWASLMALVPGAIDSGPSDQRSIRFAGHSLADNNFLFDGIDDTGIYNQEQQEYVRLQIPLDSIAEFRVQSQNFGADVGTTPGGQVLVASASGTNNFHGDLFDYLRNSVLDSRSPFDGPSPSPFVMNQFGGALGGPIVPNRTFFYADYEGVRQHRGQDQIGLVPSPSFAEQTVKQTPALAPVLSAFPQGTSPTSNPDVWNYDAVLNQLDNEDSGMIRIDHHFSDRTTAFLRYNADEAVYDIPTGSLNTMALTDTKLQNGVVELMHVFSASLVNEAEFGVNEVITHRANVNPLPFSVSVSNLSSLAGSSARDEHNMSLSYIDNITWTKGRHIFKFGARVVPIIMDTGESASGTLTYLSLNSLLSNDMEKATYTATLPLQPLRKTEVFAYAQDQYQITPNLTANLGVHYDFFNAFHEADGYVATPFDLATCGGYCAPNSPFEFPRYADLDPRVGIAWARGKTVLRAGGGIYHGDGENDDQDWPVSNSTESYSLSSVTSPGLAYPITPFLQNTTGIASPRDLYRNRKDLYVAAWTASVQRALPWKILGTVSYLGNKGTHLLTTTYVNTVNPVTGVRPYPQFGVIEWRGNDGNSTFNALQLNVQRAFGNGVFLSANYMWSHSINDGGVGGNEDQRPQNVFCRSCEKASSQDDVRQVYNIAAVYDLPLGAGKRWLARPGIARALLGGWHVSGIATGRTGLPVNVVLNRADSALPDQYSMSQAERPDLVPGVSLTPPGGRTPNDWINALAFVTPAAGTYGNAGRNLVRGPGLYQLDLSVAKKFPLTERCKMEFRVDGFNVLNRAQFANPNANLSSPLTFGVITTTVNEMATGSGTPREFQFALRLSF